MSKSITVQLFSGSWIVGWLFTWGYAGLTGWKAFWALFIWAYYLGQYMGALI